MNFLALSAPAAYALLAGVALAIALLHLLRPPRPSVTVASLLLWARAGRERKRPFTRRLIALLLALGAGLSLALALTRAEIPAIAPSAQRLLLVLDNSPSMAARTRDGHSRWQHGLEQARALVDAASASSHVMVWDTRGRLDSPGFVGPAAARAVLGRLPDPGWGSVRLPPAPFAAGAQVHVFTDGVTQLALPAGAIVHAVFEPADNVALTLFEARPLARDPTRYEALLHVVNASPGSRHVRLLITGQGGFSLAQDLDLAAGESADASFDVSDFPGGVLGASAICTSDALALDDVAYAVVPPHNRRRVLLVSPGNPALENALRSLPGVRLKVVRPAQYSRAGEHDAFVFDRFAPQQPPHAGALLLRPPARDWLASPSTARSGPRITHWSEDHPVSGGIAWGNLRLERAAMLASGEGSQALVSARRRTPGALVVGGEARARWVQVGFALEDSNFALQPDFPVFVGKALSWVSEPALALTRPTGTVEVPLRDAQVRDGSGRAIAVSATEQGVVFEAPRPDVYTLTRAGKQAVVVASLSDPHAVLINRTPLEPVTAAMHAGSASPPWWGAELWMLLLWLAAGLLLMDWARFTRHGTA